jgi:putative ABC transport system ATP-binding protein
MKENVLSLRNITKQYVLGDEALTVLNQLTLDVNRNDFIALTGPSGSGKSTLMNILGCLDKATSGEYYLGDRDVSQLNQDELSAVRNKRIGFIFQSFNLLPRQTALDNVAQPLIFRGEKPARRRELAAQALTEVGLGDRLSHYPNQLSGGQKQRVAVARALVGKPDILLADEPTGNLDSKTTDSMMNLFESLHAQGQTLVIVTHETDIAERCLRQIVLRDGVIESDSGGAQHGF